MSESKPPCSNPFDKIERFTSVASSLFVLPVILLTMLEFVAPLKATHTFEVSRHASEVYAREYMLHTLDLYIQPHAQVPV